MSATHVFALPNYPASVQAICADGIVRTARPSGNGQADTYFSIPAFVQVRADGRRLDVAGYISPADGPDTAAPYTFRAYTYRANHGAITPTN